MTTLEGILDHFAKHAADDNVRQMETHKTFDGGVRVLKAYAHRNMGLSSDTFKAAERRSRRHYTGPTDTLEDLWLLMLYRNDLNADGPPSGSTASEQSASSESRPPPSFKPYKKRGFGLITPGTGKLINFPYRTRKLAYFRDTRSGGRCKAEVHDGRVRFVRFSFIKKFWSLIHQVGVPGFSVAWNVNFDQMPNNLLFSRIFKDRNKSMVDWAMSLVESGDILVSKESQCAGFVPAKLASSDKSAMYLSKPLSRAYLEGKRFLYDPHSKDVYWAPSDSPYFMKVQVQRKARYNTFERVKEHRTDHSSRLRDCVVSDMRKQFA